VHRRLAVALAASVACGCGGATRTPSTAPVTAKPRTPEQRAASYAPPPAAVIAAAGPTPAARNASARAELRRAARDLQAYHRAHGTYAIGPIANLHRLDPGTALVDFVDARESSFFLAVNPPTTTTIWRYNFDHDRAQRVCGPGGTGCPAGRLW